VVAAGSTGEEQATGSKHSVCLSDSDGGVVEEVETVDRRHRVESCRWQRQLAEIGADHRRERSGRRVEINRDTPDAVRFEEVTDGSSCGAELGEPLRAVGADSAGESSLESFGDEVLAHQTRPSTADPFIRKLVRNR